jgi:serine/threonine protein phosphatase 1
MMFNFIRKQDRALHAPKGRRAYAIGDIHGRDDLLDLLIADIERDIASRPPAENYLVFLGDYIDRGPGSRAVIDRLSGLKAVPFTPIFLIGNHEEVLLRLLAGEHGLLSSWLRFGGAECCRSYGLDPKKLGRQEESIAIEALRRAIPERHVEFLRTLVDTFRFGDYLFVHAGIRPGVDLGEQSQLDLRWIRAAFLDDRTDHGFMVIHGHTISEAVDEQPNRIGIDTGAYWSGVLSAIGLEGTDRWYLSTNATRTEQRATLVD